VTLPYSRSADESVELAEPVEPTHGGLRPSLDDVDRQYVQRVLAEAGGDTAGAAEILDVSVRALQRKVEELWRRAHVERARPMTSGLPAELREFLFRYASTLPAVEALMMLQSATDVAWTAARLADRVGPLGEKAAADLLAAFHWHGFLVADSSGTFRYQPRSAELERQASRLATAYVHERLAVLLELANLERLTPIRNFADAFRLRKDRPGG
jgi:hypothetical protein